MGSLYLFCTGKTNPNQKRKGIYKMQFYKQVIDLPTQKALTPFQKKVRSVLTGAVKRLTKGWTRRAYARTATGANASSTASNAVKFCAVGAMTATKKGNNAIIAARRLVEHTVLNDGNLVSYNDETAKNKYQVIRVLKQAEQNIETFDFTPWA
jgi:hypothetical protein